MDYGETAGAWGMALAGGVPIEDAPTIEFPAVPPQNAALSHDFPGVQGESVRADQASELMMEESPTLEFPPIDIEERRASLAARASGLVRGIGRRVISMYDAANEVYQTGKEEIRAASYGAVALFGANVVGVLVEQVGGLNEWTLSNVGIRTYEHTGQNIGLTMLSTGLTAFAIQSVLGLATTVSIRHFPKTLSKIQEKLGGNKVAENSTVTSAEEMPPEPLEQPQVAGPLPAVKRLNTRFLDAVGLGTSIKTILKDRGLERSLSRNAQSVESDAGLVLGGVAVLAGVIASLLTVANSKSAGPVGHDVARYAADVLTSPYPYVLLFASRLLPKRSEGKLG